MNILTQEAVKEEVERQLLKETTLKDLINPSNPSFSIDNYSSLITDTSNLIYQLIRDSIIVLLEKMDDNFRYSNDRINRYYVKVKRPRTLITPIGIITYSRTIYQSRIDSSIYIHIDERLGLPKYDRYDPLVKSMIVEYYANNNSMLKVGKLIGDRIYSPYSVDSNREHYCISRQTVFNTLRKTGEFIFTPKSVNYLVEELIIMADEKYIATQGNNRKKTMVKAATIFESMTTEGSRRKLINKHVYLHRGNNFWDNIQDIIHNKYQLSKIKKIHILGDGASWIKTGVSELRTSDTETTFSLDKFHYKQAINRITSNKEIKEKLINYIENDDMDNFRKLTKSIIKDKSLSLKSSKGNIRYIINNWQYILNMIYTIKIPCSMESAISHNLASNFTSVPKAYNTGNLKTYINHRRHYLNNYDLRQLYLESLKVSLIKNKRDLDPKLDFSMFDSKPQYDKSSNSNWVKGFIARN